jgi:hypothetical protein
VKVFSSSRIMKKTPQMNEGWCMPLYESLLDPRVATSSKQSLYLNLLYKSLKNDLNVRALTRRTFKSFLRDLYRRFR